MLATSPKPYILYTWEYGMTIAPFLVGKLSSAAHMIMNKRRCQSTQYKRCKQTRKNIHREVLLWVLCFVVVSCSGQETMDVGTGRPAVTAVASKDEGDKEEESEGESLTLEE